LWKSDEAAMSVEFNHTIVWSSDSKASAKFLAHMLGLAAPKKWGPFQVVTAANGVNVDFMDKEGEIRSQHYAFLVSETEFDQIFARLKEQGLAHWADPARTKASEINRHDNGRGVYFEDPSGHLLEVITRPYGSSGWEP
jgi:catechol 2,3-dioxygenase-like lactoylglutathione lyase family enzyme